MVDSIALKALKKSVGTKQWKHFKNLLQSEVKPGFKGTYQDCVSSSFEIGTLYPGGEECFVYLMKHAQRVVFRSKSGVEMHARHILSLVKLDCAFMGAQTPRELEVLSIFYFISAGNFKTSYSLTLSKDEEKTLVKLGEGWAGTRNSLLMGQERDEIAVLANGEKLNYNTVTTRARAKAEVPVRLPQTMNPSRSQRKLYELEYKMITTRKESWEAQKKARKAEEEYETYRRPAKRCLSEDVEDHMDDVNAFVMKQEAIIKKRKTE